MKVSAQVRGRHPAITCYIFGELCHQYGGFIGNEIGRSISHHLSMAIGGRGVRGAGLVRASQEASLPFRSGIINPTFV